MENPSDSEVFFLCAGDVMAARVVGIRQEGVNPCRMVPSMRDEVHGSCMTSRARFSVRGCELPCRSATCAFKFIKRINLENRKKKQASLSGEQDSRGRGEKPPVFFGAQDTL